MHDFPTLGISEALVRAVQKLGFSEPTSIQQKTIPALLGGDRDLIALARTGTGKTAAYGLPLLQLLGEESSGRPEALVLSPTRELCCQIAGDLAEYAAFMRDPGIVPVYGGAGILPQLRALRKHPRVIVATPGRLIDLMNRGSIDLSGIRMLVLDEADEMLSMGFKDELETILAATPEEKRTCLFSATMPGGIRTIAEVYLKHPAEISDLSAGKNEGSIEHRYILVRPHDRSEALRRFIALETELSGIVFCRTKESTRQVAELLVENGCAADAIHGDLSQAQRDSVMARFRKGVVRVLVATDVAARGLDVDDLTHVIHYELPSDVESYVHRSGRTGRAGKSGISLALVTPSERARIRRLEYAMSARFERVDAPSGSDIIARRAEQLLDRIADDSDAGESPIDAMLETAVERFADMSKEEIVKRFLRAQLDDQIAAYGSARRLEAPSMERRGTRETAGARWNGGGETGGYRRPGAGYRRSEERFSGSDRGRSGGRFRDGNSGFGGGSRPTQDRGDFVRIDIPGGKADGMTKTGVLEMVNRSMGTHRFPVGTIRILNRSSFLEVPADVASELTRRLAGAETRR